MTMRTETRGWMKKEGKLTDNCTHSNGGGGDEERVDEAARGDCRLRTGLEEITPLGEGEQQHLLHFRGRRRRPSFTSSVFPSPPLPHGLFEALLCSIFLLLQLQRGNCHAFTQKGRSPDDQSLKTHSRSTEPELLK